MFKEMPALAGFVSRMLPPGPPAQPGVPEEENLAARVKAAGGAQWFLRAVLPNIAPGGMDAGIRQTTTTSEKLSDLNVEIDKIKEEIGHEFLPVVRDFAEYLKTNLPEIKEDLTAFANALLEVIKALGWMVNAIPLKPKTEEQQKKDLEESAGDFWKFWGGVFGGGKGAEQGAEKQLAGTAVSSPVAMPSGFKIDPLSNLAPIEQVKYAQKRQEALESIQGLIKPESFFQQLDRITDEAATHAWGRMNKAVTGPTGDEAWKTTVAAMTQASKTLNEASDNIRRMTQPH
jgi:hypothetical protein